MALFALLFSCGSREEQPVKIEKENPFVMMESVFEGNHDRYDMRLNFLSLQSNTVFYIVTVNQSINFNSFPEGFILRFQL